MGMSRQKPLMKRAAQIRSDNRRELHKLASDAAKHANERPHGQKKRRQRTVRARGHIG